MKKFLPLLFALSMITPTVFAWGWGGDGDCPYSKNQTNEDKTEQLEHSDN